MNTEVLKNFFIYAEYPPNSLENDAYLNMYWAIKKLFMDGRYNREDITVLENYLYGYSQREISNLMTLDRRYVAKRLKYILHTLSLELDKNGE